MALDRYEIFNVKSIYFLSKYFTTMLKNITRDGVSVYIRLKGEGEEKKLPVSSKFFPKV